MKTKQPRNPLTTNANFERVRGETVLCRDHMRETLPYGGGERCVECGSYRAIPAERESQQPAA